MTAPGPALLYSVLLSLLHALNPDDQNRIAYWVDGYAQAKGEAAVGTVAFDKFGQPIGALVEDCKATPKETLWQKLKKHSAVSAERPGAHPTERARVEQ